MTISARKLSAAIALAMMSAGMSATVQASGFALIENSASGMGNAFAGGAASAEDASTIYFNPAGMTKLSGTQIVVAGHIVSPTADFTNNGSTINPLLGGGALQGGDDDGGATAFVPNFYYAKSLGEDMWFGVGVTAPFGLSTEYDEGWVGRYHATTSELMTLNINPSFAAKATETVSIGFGLSIQYAEATLANHLDSAAICLGKLAPLGVTPADCAAEGIAAAGTLATDSSQELSGDDWSIGWNFGLIFDLDESSRLGVAYRSSVKQDLEGDVDFNLYTGLENIISGLPTTPYPYNSLFSDTAVAANINLPETLSVSYYRDVSPKLAVMADMTFTKWSNFEDLIVTFDNVVQSPAVTPEDWTNSMRYAVGMSYKYSDTLKYRAGLAYDETPIRSAELRTPRIPGHDRTWLSLGLGYKIDANTSIDIGYSHLFVDDTDINNTDPSFGHTLVGTYDASVDILSAQVNFKF